MAETKFFQFLFDQGLVEQLARDYYALRTDIEERHRQVKCFWDLTRFPSTAWSLIVSQTVFVLLTYSLLPLHLRHYGHQELNRRTPETTRRLKSAARPWRKPAAC